MAAHLLIRAIYDYQASDLKVLHCKAGDRFIIIKQTEPRGDWLYVVNCQGKLGYIPANYTEPDSLEDSKLLELIDTIISVLDADHNDPKIITIRQINHAQVKLTQLRCEVLSQLQSKPGAVSSKKITTNQPSDANFIEVVNTNDPDPNLYKLGENDSSGNVQEHILGYNCDSINVQKPVISTSEAGIQVDLIEQTTNDPTILVQGETTLDEMATIEIDDSLAADLIERVRVSTELSHGMCKLTIETVINYLREKMPMIEKTMTKLIDKLEAVDQCPSPLVMKNSSDLIKLRELFHKLWICKADDNKESGLKAIRMRSNVKCLMENLVSYLNWEEDPTLLINYFGKPMKTCDRPNAVHKLLTEVFEDPELANLFYYNDVRVMIDILISHLNNIQDEDENRFSYLKLLYNIIKNTNYKEEPHKLIEVNQCIDAIYSHESSPDNEKRMVRMIKELLTAETV
ncbi:uncharacterized protein LOC107369227 [Tetranychus urticae]|uniref:uncharacterized protein LOC107369227 n=1 Tax=Tetranychus urticae TaxID=32264 RepID=UPI00077B926B|nr:uncharacterized protein LOC107369227 [Tetranychus urticae]